VSTAYSYDLAEVKEAIAGVLESDQADGSANFFPNADGGNYGPNFIRLAWHCAGTFMEETGHGGCDGGRIRFPPESEWADNAGLITSDGDGRVATLEQLRPVKERFGESLSWADLIILSGDVAIEQMGGPQLGFCGGRPDEADGARSHGLRTDMIYVDAGNTDAAEIREAFSNMGMNDRETIALIAGGHTFGRCHTGRSGFEGAWTQTPSTWSNLYIENLLGKTWERVTLENGLPQFRVQGAEPGSPDADLMMLVADEALKHDDAYMAILEEYRADNELLKAEFGAAWQKLVNGGRIQECSQNNGGGGDELTSASVHPASYMAVFVALFFSTW
jgi:catalase (peroxidase I)